MPALGLTGAVIAALAGCWYVYTIIRGDTRPHRVTWAVWSLVGVMGAGSAVQGGAGPGSLVVLSFAAVHIVVFALSLTRRFGKPGGEWYDRPLGAAALLAAVLWRVFDLPAAFAATVAVVADGLALWPTLRESWRQPRTESLAAWLLDSLACLLGVVAVARHDYAALAYPFLLTVGNSAVAAALLVRRFGPRQPARAA